MLLSQHQLHPKKVQNYGDGDDVKKEEVAEVDELLDHALEDEDHDV